MKSSSINRANIIFKKFKHGLDTATKSFKLLSKNKKLLLYIGVPLLVFAFIEILTYNIQKCSVSGYMSPIFQNLPENISIILNKFGASSSWMKFTFVIIFYLIHITTMTIAKMAITFHTNKIQKYNNLGFNCAFNLFKPKIKIGLLWATFILIPIAMFTLISSFNQCDISNFAHIFYTIIIFALSTTWTLITAFVIQALTIDDLKILPAIKKSIFTVRKIFFEYLGAIFWIAIIGSISSLPFIFLDKFINMATYNHLAIAIILIIYCIITSAYEVSKTLLFNEFRQKNL